MLAINHATHALERGPKNGAVCPKKWGSVPPKMGQCAPKNWGSVPPKMGQCAPKMGQYLLSKIYSKNSF